ncbi:MAG: pilus assembly protein [Rhodocyclaceae bacterium]|nr:pilus assembly protein [Rhodocyclaceae bacterium]
MTQRTCRLRHRQRGAAGIEFALIFIPFFVIFYAIVSYSLAMLLMQGFTQAAEEGARASIAVDPSAYSSTADYAAKVQSVAVDRAAAALSWLPAGARRQVIDGQQIRAVLVGSVVSVTVTYPDYSTNGLVPTLTLPVIGAVPRLPTNLVGAASLSI